MTKVYITDYVNDPTIEREILGNNLAKAASKDVEVLLVWHQTVNTEFLDAFPNLKAVVRYGVGFDAIDLVEATKRGIVVCNTPDYGTEEVSDTAIAMIVNITRGVTRYDYACRNYTDDWQENVIPSIKRNSEIKLGVIGAGRIGASVLLKAKALRLQTGFYDPYVPRGHEKTLDSTRTNSLEELLKNSDIISIHCPLNEETEGLVNASFLSKMKHGASLVNTARGKIISTIDDFYEPLKNGHLSNVSLDVIPDEPPKPSKLIDAWRNREHWLGGRFILNPHTAYFSDTAYREMRQKAALNAKRVLEKKMPFNVLNKVNTG